MPSCVVTRLRHGMEMDATQMHEFIIKNNNLPNLRMLEMCSTLLGRGHSKGSLLNILDFPYHHMNLCMY